MVRILCTVTVDNLGFDREHFFHIWVNGMERLKKKKNASTRVRMIWRSYTLTIGQFMTEINVLIAEIIVIE